MKPTVEERFWSKVGDGPLLVPHLGPCSEWQAFRNPAGYGMFSFGGTMRLAHRVRWHLAYGKWPDPLALHHCDNKACVQLSHLYEGTNRENTGDAITRGLARLSYPGERNNHAKLNWSQVREIRALAAAGGVYQYQLAERFGVSQVQIGHILSGAHWRETP